MCPSRNLRSLHLRYHVFYTYAYSRFFLYVESARSRHDGYAGDGGDVTMMCWLAAASRIKAARCAHRWGRLTDTHTTRRRQHDDTKASRNIKKSDTWAHLNQHERPSENTPPASRPLGVIPPAPIAQAPPQLPQPRTGSGPAQPPVLPRRAAPHLGPIVGTCQRDPRGQGAILCDRSRSRSRGS